MNKKYLKIDENVNQGIKRLAYSKGLVEECRDELLF